MAQNNDTSEFKFRVSSQLKNIVGKDLIADDRIAMFELVKNSFDARALKVKIIFEEDKITIWDDGKGMSKTDLLNKWLFLAYSAKKEGNEDDEQAEGKQYIDYRDKIRPKQQYYAGAKGIGRFSTDKLGAKLTLTTKKIAENDSIHRLIFDWNEFEEKAERLFQDIVIEHQELQSSPFEGFEHGLILEITSLRAKWGQKEILDLKKSLEKLINPVGENSNDRRFDIEIICEAEKRADTNRQERERINGSVKNFVFETLDIKTTQIQTIISNDKIITILFDRGQLVYKIQEKNDYQHLKNAKIIIFYLNQSAKNNFKRGMGVDSVNFGHIFLFNNGFRVYPFGEVKYDPLELDKRKVQGYARYLGTREVIGRIELWGNSIEQFQEKSSRDGGLKETEGRREMEGFFFETLKKLERYVSPILWKIQERSGDKEEIVDTASKKQIISLISRLAGSKEIELLEFGKELIDIFNETLENQSDEDFDNLIDIAKKTGQKDFEEQVIVAKQRYLTLLREKEEAERQKMEEERKRHEAEEKARIEEQKRHEAEQAAKEADVKRREAELKAQEAEFMRLKAEEEAREARERATLEQQRRKQKESQVRFLESVSTLEIADVLNLNHQIGIDANTIKTTLLNLQNLFRKSVNTTASEAAPYIERISLATEKILSVVQYTTKANFMAATLDTESDIVAFIRNYIYTILTQHIGKEVVINVGKVNFEFVRKFKPINLTIILDNLISNSRKKGAKNVTINFEQENECLKMVYSDDGLGLDSKISDPNEIFQRGFTTTRGSGLGMYHVKRILFDEMKSDIAVNNQVHNGIEFIITFTK